MALAKLQYFSAALQKHTQVTLLLPDQDPGEGYVPWLLLHGLSDDESVWTRRTSLERYIDGTPFLVAMPDGGRGFYCDAAEGFAYATAIGEELPALLHRYFPLRDEWAIGGLSMGGYGALRLGLAHPERFRSIHSHSGAVGFGHFEGYRNEPEFHRILGEPTVGGPNDLFRLAAECPNPPAVRIDCGTEDFLLQQNRAFTEHLTEVGFAHTYAEYPGDHDWEYWDTHVQEQAAFHLENLRG